MPDLKPIVRANGLVKPCCMPANLVSHRARPDLIVRVCKICGAKHYEMTASPGRIFAKL